MSEADPCQPEISHAQSPAPLVRALTRASALVAEGLSEDELVPRLAHCIAEAVSADLAAVYLHPEPPLDQAAWRLAGHYGADAEILAAPYTAAELKSMPNPRGLGPWGTGDPIPGANPRPPVEAQAPLRSPVS